MIRGTASPKASQASSITFFSPQQPDAIANGNQTLFTFTLPASGRLRFTEISNGSPGGSGASGAAGLVRSGGGPGASGAKNVWDVTIDELKARYPGITGIEINFGTLGTPGAGQSGANGAAGTASSNLIYRYLSSSPGTFRSVQPGNPGGGGNVGSASTATSGTAGSQPSGVNGVNSSIGNQSLTTGLAASAGGNAMDGPTAGGTGGGLTAANAESSGSKGGTPLNNSFSAHPGSFSAVVGGVAGAGDGKPALSPYLGKSPLGGLGGSGGGSSNSTTVNGGNAADGTGYGAGGGGGGAGTSGGSALSGAGGKGSYGCVQIEAIPL